MENKYINQDGAKHIFEKIKSVTDSKLIKGTLPSNTNLNSINSETYIGRWNCATSNTVLNKPDNVNAFALDVFHSAGGNYYVQVLYPNGSDIAYTRYCVDNVWSTWRKEVASSDLDNYLTKTNPTGTGSFSMNRKDGTKVGNNSFAEGYDTTASGEYSHAEGNGTTASYYASHAEGILTTASGYASHAEGVGTTVSGNYSHTEGQGTTASGDCSHVQGVYNIEDTEGKYAHIVGNGDYGNRSNAHTLDWDGNAWFAGNVTVGADSGKSTTVGLEQIKMDEVIDAKGHKSELIASANKISVYSDIEDDDYWKECQTNITGDKVCADYGYFTTLGGRSLYDDNLAYNINVWSNIVMSERNITLGKGGYIDLYSTNNNKHFKLNQNTMQDTYNKANHAVSSWYIQEFSDEEKECARDNIGAGTVSSVSVKMDGEIKGTITDSGTIDLGSTDVSLTSSSPLTTSSASNILGIECEGKSEQSTTQTLATVQGSIALGSGDVINQTPTTSEVRCVTNVVYLNKGAVVSASSGFDIYTAFSTTSDGIITNKVSWVNSRTLTDSGYYRFIVRKSNNTTCAPNDFEVVASNVLPTPTNPIPIVDASGVVVAHTINYLTEGFVDKKVYIGSSGAISTSYVGYGASNDLMKVEPNTEYTFGFTSDAEMYISGFVFFNTSKSRVSNIDIESQKVKQATFTVPSNAEYLAIDVVSSRYSSVAIDVSKMSNVHLVKDIPYQSNSINIDGNLIDFNEVVQGSLYSEDGSEASATNRLRTDYISVANGKTYTISCVGCEVRTVYEYNASKGFVKYILASGSTYSYTSTSNSYIRILFRYTDDSTIMPNKDMHLRCIDGSAIILRSIGTVADTLVVKQDGSGVLTKRVGTVDLSTLDWILGWGDKAWYADTLTDGVAVSSSAIPNLLAEQYVASPQTSVTTTTGIGDIGYWMSSSTIKRLACNNGSTTEKPKGKLYYPLATPTTTTLTSTQVASILALRTYNGTTIVDSEIVKDVTYLNSTNNGIAISRINNRVNELSNANKYSYVDTIIGAWADGKDLHRMVISTTTPSSTNADIISSLVNQSDCDVKTINGCFTTASSTKIPINFYSASSYFGYTYVNNKGIKMIVSNSAFCNRPCEIIVEYTLNEDSAIATLSDENN